MRASLDEQIREVERRLLQTRRASSARAVTAARDRGRLHGGLLQSRAES